MADAVEAPVLVRLIYTRGKDRGMWLQLPVYPCAGEEWRVGVAG